VLFILQRLHGKNQSWNVLESPDMFSERPEKSKLYLASNSPRRRELVTLGGWDVEVLSAQVDETPLQDEGGADYVMRLAKAKVLSAARQVTIGSLIIAADTTVVDAQDDGEQILGKPRDADEAVHMLRGLRGHAHRVHTAISVFSTRDGTLLCDLCTTEVPMREYSDAEIEAYVLSGDPMDKAGAYAIQHSGFHPVERIDGCYANVMGLPLCHLMLALKRLGIDPKTDVPQACQAALGYNCPVYAAILNERIPDYACV
jgi:MAF protein